VMVAALVGYVMVLVNAIFLALPPDQQGVVKEALRKLIATMWARFLSHPLFRRSRPSGSAIC
jgi:hypothetical protein